MIPKPGDKVAYQWWGSSSTGWVKSIHKRPYSKGQYDEYAITIRNVDNNLFVVYEDQIIEILHTYGGKK